MDLQVSPLPTYLVKQGLKVLVLEREAQILQLPRAVALMPNV